MYRPRSGRHSLQLNLPHHTGACPLSAVRLSKVRASEAGCSLPAQVSQKASAIAHSQAGVGLCTTSACDERVDIGRRQSGATSITIPGQGSQSQFPVPWGALGYHLPVCGR
jgi:hypothetical protein